MSAAGASRSAATEDVCIHNNKCAGILRSTTTAKWGDNSSWHEKERHGDNSKGTRVGTTKQWLKDIQQEEDDIYCNSCTHLDVLQEEGGTIRIIART